MGDTWDSAPLPDVASGRPPVSPRIWSAHTHPRPWEPLSLPRRLDWIPLPLPTTASARRLPGGCSVTRMKWGH